MLALYRIALTFLIPKPMDFAVDFLCKRGLSGGGVINFYPPPPTYPRADAFFALLYSFLEVLFILILLQYCILLLVASEC